MLEQLRETARGVQSTLREATLLAEIEKLREAVEATEQTLATQKHRMELLAKELQKEPGHLARLAGTDAGAALVGMIRGVAGQPQRPAGAQQPPPQVIHIQSERAASGRPAAPQTLRVQPQRPAAPARPAPEAVKPAPAPAAVAGPGHRAVPEAPQATASSDAVQPEAETPHESPAPAAETSPHDEFDAHEKLLLEAIETGRHALADLDHCVSQAQELARAGVWRIVKGMVSTHSPEHAKIEEVRGEAHEVQELLGSFEQQVRTLHEQFGHRVDVADLKGFATRFGQALAAGPQEEHLGHRAIEAARAAYHDVRRMCTRLHLDAIALRARRAAQQRFWRKHGLTA